ncbi:MAG: helix-hairpin-helix domain-containing protein [Chloroflexi bacterium]|nr:helix-hairpin-helix domain-containing protein [Chloroflexota bacterium]
MGGAGGRPGRGAFLVLNRPQNPAITIVLPTPTVAGPLRVQVTGAVSSPGLYTLEAGSRAEDLVRAAQGALPEANLSGVNLARRLADGEHLYIPRAGETPVPSGSPLLAQGASQPVNINVASALELASLPGIGPAKAQAIVDYRQQNGLFQRPDELMKVPGIGPATYQGLKDRVTAGGAP